MIKSYGKLLPAALVAMMISGCASHSQPNIAKQYSHLLNQSNNPQVAKLYHALLAYQPLASDAWPELRSDHKITLGSQSELMPAIRQRLALLGYLPHRYINQGKVYDMTTDQAVIRFQHHYGLKPDGVIGGKTLSALNVTPKHRIAEIITSMQGWAKVPGNNESEYIQVNIPSFELNVIKGQQSVLSMRVVVGKPSWPTPTLSSNITTVVLNPTWNIPSSIVEKDIVHHMIRNPNYLTEERIRIYKTWQRNAEEIQPQDINWSEYAGAKRLPYRFTQIAGAHNVLGDVKFLFPNKHSVYLHDTQAKDLFARQQRDFSHGCIRLARPMALFTYLIQEHSTYTPEQALSHLGKQQPKYFSIRHVPLYITYMTAWVGTDGSLYFGPDIYHKVS